MRTLLAVSMLAGTFTWPVPSRVADAPARRQDSGAQAGSQQKRAGDAVQNGRFTVLRINSEMLDQLNDFTARGYHIAYRSEWGYLVLEQETDGNADVEYEYVVHRPARIEAFQSSVNQAMSEGYRLVPGLWRYDYQRSSLEVGAVMEKAGRRATSAPAESQATEVPRHEYQIVKGWSESRLSELAKDGFRVVDAIEVMTGSESWQDYVILEKQVSNEAAARTVGYQLQRLKASVRKLERELNKYGSLGYRLGALTELGYVLERPLNAEEHWKYVVPFFKSNTPLQQWERALNDAASRGYRLLPQTEVMGGNSGWFSAWQAVIMEKPVGSARNTHYRVLDPTGLDNAVAAREVGDYSVAGLFRTFSRWGQLKGMAIILERQGTRP